MLYIGRAISRICVGCVRVEISITESNHYEGPVSFDISGGGGGTIHICSLSERGKKSAFQAGRI